MDAESDDPPISEVEGAKGQSKQAGDVNDNTECLSKTDTVMVDESSCCEKDEEMETSKKDNGQWKKVTKKTKKRNYRRNKSGEAEGDGVSVKDSDPDDLSPQRNDELDVEEMENCNITDKTGDCEQDASSSEKLSTGKLKRSKCKSSEQAQTSDDRKKRKKGELLPTENDGHESDDPESKDESSDEDGTASTKSTISKSSNDSSSEQEEEKTEEKELTDDEVWLQNHTKALKPPMWRSVEEIRKREYGLDVHSWPYKACGSLAMVRRFERQFTLDAHEGCVNALHFNQSGSLLASGSDDLDIHIWDWTCPRDDPFISYSSGHRSNVFQAKFMPNSNDSTVISCARDGQVRVGYLSSTGSCRDTRKVAQHRGAAHKLALDSTGSRSTFLSCGEDAVVMGFDLRENKPSKKLVTVKADAKKIALYSIDTNPSKTFEFAVSGRDHWARIYDRRMLDSESPETVAKYCPFHIDRATNSTDVKANITCVVYNHDGSELLCSYNDEDIYLFDLTHSSGDEFKTKYKGHRNNATVKGVNFYGPKSEFIVSGSDCGNVFLWEKTSSKIVQFMEGDEGGVVNVLEPHPNLPLLATSGLDKNIKIWGPTGDGVLNEDKLKELMLSNRHERHEENNNARAIDGHLLWFLMRSLRNASGRARRGAGGEEEDEDDSPTSSSNSFSESDSEEDGPDRRRPIDPCLTS